MGWTPLVELKHIVQNEGLDIRIVGKLESYQPLSSIKDRSALRYVATQFWLLYIYKHLADMIWRYYSSNFNSNLV